MLLILGQRGEHGTNNISEKIMKTISLQKTTYGNSEILFLILWYILYHFVMCHIMTSRMILLLCVHGLKILLETLVFPNVTKDDKEAIIIKLSHGCTVSWDGKISIHASSNANRGISDHLNGKSVPLRDVEASVDFIFRELGTPTVFYFWLEMK